MPTKMSPDSTAEVASSESLSFAGLVCIQDQLSNPVKQSYKVKEQEPEFEFSSTGLFPSGQHLPHEAAAVLSNQTRALKPVELEDFLSPPIKGNRRRAEHRNKRRKSFTQKIFQSFVKPCNNCRAVQTMPSVKERQLQ
ncbi:hypothetical protein F511_21486 [Dorcoceras hygrometricum]|uniref:Uncharacterized protein n=1 Tax=Dorcoceras hygrometricum TaxID=472368 RepID=A0A2Z7D4F5_9LAMI|nr:hypothetical protein F511_21486 [Dorcoceras hygrometricum]